MNLNNRFYRLEVQTPDGRVLTIEPPFSIKFSIKRGVYSSVNSGDFTIMNLDYNSRNQLYKDRFAFTDYRQIKFYAGYGKAGYGKTPVLIFQGNVFNAYSVKEKTDWVTTLKCFDGMHAVQNGFMSQTIKGGVPFRDLIQAAMGSFTSIKSVKAGEVGDKLVEGDTVAVGKPLDVLADELDVIPYIDKETLYVVKDTEVIAGLVLTLGVDDLLGTPLRSETTLIAKCIFNPGAEVGRKCKIASKESNYNGEYKILGVEHVVEISGAKCGTAVTTLQLYYGASGFKEII